MTVQLFIYNTHAHLAAPARVQSAVRDAFKVKDPNAFWMKKNGKGKGWDGFHYFASNPPTVQFSPGLVIRALSTMAALGVDPDEVELVDRRNIPVASPFAETLNVPFTFWPEQLDLVEAFLAAKRGVWDSATGSGKTEMATEVIRRLGLPALFVVPNNTLLYQTRDRLQEALGFAVGIIGDGEWQTDTQVVVASIHTLGKRIQKGAEGREELLEMLAEGRPVVVYDEAHRMKMKTWLDVGKLVKAPYVLAMTGTLPEGQLDRWRMEKLAGPVLGKISNREQVLAGRAATCHILVLYVDQHTVPPDTQAWLKANDNWPDLRRYYAWENEHRHQLVGAMTRHLVDAGQPTVVMADPSYDQLDALHQAVTELGVVAERMDGNTPGEERQEGLHRLAEFTTQAIVCTPILDEGVNVPRMGAAIDAGTGKSLVQLRQRIGRVIRAKKEGPNVAFFVVLMDRTHPRLADKGFQKFKSLAADKAYIIHELTGPEEAPQVLAKILRG